VVFKYEMAETKDKALPSSVAPPPGNVTPELAMMVPTILEPMSSLCSAPPILRMLIQEFFHFLCHTT
jgi:hypothetical protein